MNKELQEELRNQNSILTKIPKVYFTDNDTIPSGYFDNMEEAFFKSISNPPRESKGGNFFNKLTVSYSIAAVLALAVFGMLLFDYSNTAQDQTLKLSQNEVLDYLHDEEIYDEPILIETSHLANRLDKLSSEEIVSYFEENEMMDYKNFEKI